MSLVELKQRIVKILFIWGIPSVIVGTILLGSLQFTLLGGIGLMAIIWGAIDLIMAYYILKRGNPREILTSSALENDRKRMKRWLERALLKQTFSGQPDNVLMKIRRVISEKNDYYLQWAEKILQAKRTGATTLLS